MDTRTVVFGLVGFALLALSRIFSRTIPRFPSLTPQARALVVAVLAGVQLVIDGASKGTLWSVAIMSALQTAGPALVDQLIEWLTVVPVPAEAKKMGVIKRSYLTGLTLTFLFVAMLLAGCAGSFEEAKLAGAPYRQLRAANSAVPATPSGVDCSQWDKGRIYWHGIGLTFDGIGAASGITAVAVPKDDEKTKFAVGLTAVGFLALGAGSEAISQGAATEWARYCSGTP